MDKINKPQYYDSIPEVPQDFEGACAVLSQANSAIYYWREEIKTIDRYQHTLKHDADNFLNGWKAVKVKAEAVIATYQLRLL